MNEIDFVLYVVLKVDEICFHYDKFRLHNFQSDQISMQFTQHDWLFLYQETPPSGLIYQLCMVTKTHNISKKLMI